MKKNFTSILLLFLVLNVFAQDPIKNFSFENWTSNSNNKQVPADWDYDSVAVEKGVLKKHTSGTHGSTALYLGVYNDANTPGGIASGSVEIRDNITTIPSSLTFDYIVRNNNSFVNGLSVEIFFYGPNGFIEDYDTYIAQSNTTFRSGTVAINKNTVANATSYLILIQYLNIGGSLSEYAVVDNLKFSTSNSNVSVEETIKPIINIYPNPTTRILNYSIPESEVPNKIIVTGVDGKQTHFQPTFTNSIDISILASGIYSVAILNENNETIGSQKVILTK
ncbi:MAG: T9SS type A sorting domain-containing protein [bacterium]